MAKHRIYTMSFARVYPEYVAKAEKKGRTKAEVNEIIRWLTGYSQEALEAQLEKQTDVETFLAEAPQLNPSRALIKGVVCGVRVEDIEEPTMQEIRYLDKLIDELAKGKTMEKILRKAGICPPDGSPAKMQGASTQNTLEPSVVHRHPKGRVICGLDEYFDLKHPEVLVQSIPGIGMLDCACRDLPTFTDAGQLVAFAGLNPHQK